MFINLLDHCHEFHVMPQSLLLIGEIKFSRMFHSGSWQKIRMKLVKNCSPCIHMPDILTFILRLWRNLVKISERSSNLRINTCIKKHVLYNPTYITQHSTEKFHNVKIMQNHKSFSLLYNQEINPYKYWSSLTLSQDMRYMLRTIGKKRSPTTNYFNSGLPLVTLAPTSH